MTISPLTSLSAGQLQALDATKKTGSTDFKGVLTAFIEVKKPEDELETYVKMTPAQRMRLAFLDSMGLKESDLDAMPAEERKAIEDKIAAAIKREMETGAEKKGSKIDISV